MGSYRAMTIADLARELAAVGVDQLRWRLVAEFLEEYRWEPADTRLSLLREEPLATGEEHWDVFLAALAEHLAAKEGQRAPTWADGRRLRRSWFPVRTRAAWVDGIVHAPAAFRRRNVFVPARNLEVA